MRWSEAEVCRALALAPGDPGLAVARITTDTRTLGPGDLFVALTGERFDGHRFLAAARDAGAVGAVVRSDTADLPGLKMFRVPDPLRAYGWLARHRRRRLSGPVVAVTGTNGKTSTKEMLAAALATKYRVHATRANLNNLVGVPQTLLEAPPETDALVVEAGANQPGEMARYREIIEPTITVITNVAAGHLEGFGSLAGVLEEKVALAGGVPLAVVGVDQPALVRRAREVAEAVVTAGLADADVVPDRVLIGPDGRPELTYGDFSFRLGQMGAHQARNAALVWAAARALGLDLGLVARALEGITIPGGRGEIHHYGALTILDDSYNANPASFEALIDLVAAMRGDRRLVFVAGTMRELGLEAGRWHDEVAARLVGLNPELLAAVGEFVPALERHRGALGQRLLTARDSEAMAAQLAAHVSGDELVVLKGSRGVALERVIPALLARAEH